MELTEKGHYALAMMVASFLACGMEYSDLLEYYIDEQVKDFMSNPDKLKEAFLTHGDGLIRHITEMNRKLKKL